jgi:hypothetical protein
MAKLLIVDDENDVLEFAANFFRKRKIDVSQIRLTWYCWIFRWKALMGSKP